MGDLYDERPMMRERTAGPGDDMQHVGAGMSKGASVAKQAAALPTSQPLQQQQQQQQPAGEAVAAYLQKHRIHLLVDRLVRDLLEARPSDSSSWMQRWLLEEHRRECAEKHSKSPHATPSKKQQQASDNEDEQEGGSDSAEEHLRRHNAAAAAAVVGSSAPRLPF